MFKIRILRTVSLLVTGAIVALPLAAQSNGDVKKQLDPSDLSFWKTIQSPTLSRDGGWFAYVLSPNEGDAEVVVRRTAGDARERRFPIGEPPELRGFPGNRSSTVALSGDGRWLTFTIYPTAADAKKLEKDKKPARNGVALLDLSSGTKRDFDGIRRSEFAGDRPDWLVLNRYPAEGASESDVLLVDLRSGLVTTVGSVGEYALDETGAYFAWTTAAKDQVGNGVQVRNLATDVVRALESDRATYRRLAWADSGLALAVLRGKADSGSVDTTYAVVAFPSVGGAAPAKTVVDPAAIAGFPTDMRVSPERAPSWSADFSTLFFGLAARRHEKESKTGRPDLKPVAGTPGAMQAPARSAPDDDLASLVIWHGKADPRLQSQQQVEESRDKSFSYLSAYRLADGTFTRLADSTLRDVEVVGKGRYALGYDRREYQRRDAIDGGQRRDAYAVDVATGGRTLILAAARYPFLASPDGSKALFYDDGEYHVYDFGTGKATTISAGAPTTFVDVEDDHNVDRPPVRPLGWAADNETVLLRDVWDIWKVPARGGGFVNLTGNGRAARIRYQRRIVTDPDEKGIDLTRPLYVETYGEWTKREGLARIAPSRAGAESLIVDDAAFRFTRAEDADIWIYTRQTATEFPDYWVAARSFSEPGRLTDANPEQKDYAWSSGSRLVDYVSEKGDSLQAALFLPADYRPGRTYPTIVYIYERLSQNLHSYSVPNETRAFNPSVYTSRGYAVLMPDIVYRVNDPGMSAVWCVVPAVHAAIATGVVDPDRVGLHGHSWGGYQSAFLATQTGTLFKGIIAGAPLTDMVSMYASVYWNNGSADMAIFESSQGRFKGNFIENYDAYIRNSPAFHAQNVQTNVLLLHNEKDGAVDFNQGITFFNTLRELEKNVILLQYVGENHGLRLPKNQKDYTIRMEEYFDHFVRGDPAADWIEHGVPRLRMDEHLKARKKKPKIATTS